MPFATVPYRQNLGMKWTSSGETATNRANSMLSPITWPFARSTATSFVCSQCRRQGAIRRFTTPTAAQSGHNRWSKIKHDKAKHDAATNKHRTLLSKDISFASQSKLTSELEPARKPDNDLYSVWTGPQCEPSPRPRHCQSETSRLPKASIEIAIARGQGISATGARLEPVTIEAMIPPSVAAVIDIQTDNKLRTLADVRLVIKEHGGQVTPTAYLFERKGQIVFRAKDGVALDDLLEPALEAGGLDILEGSDGAFEVYTEPAATKTVTDALTKALGLEVQASDIVYDPSDRVQLQSMEEEENLASMINKLKDIQGVQEIYVNAD